MTWLIRYRYGCGHLAYTTMPLESKAGWEQARRQYAAQWCLRCRRGETAPDVAAMVAMKGKR